MTHAADFDTLVTSVGEENPPVADAESKFFDISLERLP